MLTYERNKKKITENRVEGFELHLSVTPEPLQQKPKCCGTKHKLLRTKPDKAEMWILHIMAAL